MTAFGKGSAPSLVSITATQRNSRPSNECMVPTRTASASARGVDGSQRCGGDAGGLEAGHGPGARLVEPGTDPYLPGADTGPRPRPANVLNQLLGLPAYDGQAAHPDADELPDDEEVIAEDPAAPTLVGTAVQELRTENGVEIYAISESRRVNAYYDPSSRTVTIPSGPGRGDYDTPSGAAVAVVRALNPHVNPNRNGWSFWIVTATGQLLQSIR
ncbi:hypothetical protein ACWDZ8_25420 [Streptomyces sp. NPDC003233]